MFLVPSPSLGTHTKEFIEVAAEQGIAVGSVTNSHLEQGALVIFTGSGFVIGQQAARLADQIFNGADPTELPVQEAEVFLDLNLKTVEALGLYIPDEILLQAHTIIR
jgi:putative ABC transport system substrate-binding protein